MVNAESKYGTINKFIYYFYTAPGERIYELILNSFYNLIVMFKLSL